MMIRHAVVGEDVHRRAHYGEMSGRFTRDAWYAEVDGEVVGTAMTGPPRDNFGPWVGELYRLDVRVGHRGQGIGSRLHDACVAAWRARGITVGVLELPAEDRLARDFCESRGWRQDGHTRTGFGGSGQVRLRRAID